MLYNVLKEAAKHDLNNRQATLFNKWELATVVLSKENQNGPIGQELLDLLDVKDRRLSREIEKVKFILINFFNLGTQHDNEFLKSQILHGCSSFSVLVHQKSLMSNFGTRLGSLVTNDSMSNSVFVDRVLWIASKFSCPHSIIWSHLPVDSSPLQPLAIWKCSYANANCDGEMACMLTKDTNLLNILCKASCEENSIKDSEVMIIKEENIQ